MKGSIALKVLSIVLLHVTIFVIMLLLLYFIGFKDVWGDDRLSPREPSTELTMFYFFLYWAALFASLRVFSKKFVANESRELTIWVAIAEGGFGLIQVFLPLLATQWMISWWLSLVVSISFAFHIPLFDNSHPLMVGAIAFTLGNFALAYLMIISFLADKFQKRV